MTSLSGNVAIITGSSSGIGKGIATAMAMKGAHVVVTSRKLERAVKVAEEIIDQGGQALPVSFNIEDPQSGIAMLQTVYQQLNKINILVNNAIHRPTIAPYPFQKTEYEQLSKAITINLSNLLEISARAHPYLLETKGVLLNIGSIVVNRHVKGIPLYTIIKGAITQATKVLAAEWAEDGIRINQINPGFIETDSMLERLGKDATKHLCNQFLPYHPLGRNGTIMDIAELAAYLVSEETKWMTGAVIDMDGGYSIQAAQFPENN